MPDESFDRIWNDPPFTARVVRGVAPGPCGYAVQFQAWVDATFEPVLENPDAVRLNQVKIFLLDRFFQFRASVPRRHRSLGASGQGHRCIFNVFEDAYHELRVAELALSPPPIVGPVRPARPEGLLEGLIMGSIGADPEFAQ
jgi:hypothetical protein